ncbi:hypothetical protein BD324DRAFT_652691 [Kockovaella imperatae]|uniref:C2H2-type domain-containing protein n=1 Tax=Kockovaella imperatae TaxID=4999 RepID=A0A1Y1UAC2_9TREE|nr:hypothetical protein BD324DRAFT_652691 [Kockovaella imperatae]ORX34969.1 hypothetical protein BD324DRAFT_652691 [Kockovaella imperatae]
MSGDLKPPLTNHPMPPTSYHHQPPPLTSAPAPHLHSSASSNYHHPSQHHHQPHQPPPPQTSLDPSTSYGPGSAHSYSSNTLVKQQQMSPVSLSHSHPSHHSHSLSHSSHHSSMPLTTIQPQPTMNDNMGNMTPISKSKPGSTGSGEGKAKPHLCTICNRGFTTGGHLQRHQRIHTGVKAFKCPFPGCETRTSRQDNLQQHYRTHLSPSLRRGSGSEARAAVNQAMEAAGLKSMSTRAPRKSKSSTNTPSSNTSAGTSQHIPSPYATPTSQNGHYGYHQMYEPQPYAYPLHHPPPPSMSLGNTAQTSATSSRGPSPTNGHSSGQSSVSSIPNAHHPHGSYYPQPFTPNYPYYPAAYRYSAPGQGHMMPYGAGHPPPAPPPHIYSPGIASEHPGTVPGGHMYSPMGSSFQAHSRESSYGGMMPGYPAPGPSPVANGYPRHGSASSLLHQAPGAGSGIGAGGPAGPSSDRGRYSPTRRRSPPDLLSQGVVDPNNMSGRPPMQMGYAPPPHSNGNGMPGPESGSAGGNSVGGMANGYGPPSHLSAYAYGPGPAAGGSETLARLQGRNSASSSSEDGSAGGQEEGGLKPPI